MDFTKIKAAAIDLDIDNERLIKEIKEISENKWTLRNSDNLGSHPWKTIWLRKNSIENFEDFKSAKMISHSDWFWDEDLKIPYLKSIVGKLPFKKLGMIRAFFLTGAIALHIDSDETTPEDITYKMGLSLTPNLEVPMTLEDIEIKEKYILFNDSLPHGFPNSNKSQISIRIFGDIDYDKLKIINLYQ